MGGQGMGDNVIGSASEQHKPEGVFPKRHFIRLVNKSLFT